MHIPSLSQYLSLSHALPHSLTDTAGAGEYEVDLVSAPMVNMRSFDDLCLSIKKLQHIEVFMSYISLSPPPPLALPRSLRD